MAIGFSRCSYPDPLSPPLGSATYEMFLNHVHLSGLRTDLLVGAAGFQQLLQRFSSFVQTF